MEDFNSAASKIQAWVEVSTEQPCPKCGKDHWCSTNEKVNRGVCRRVECGVAKKDKNGATYWIYAIHETELPELAATAANSEERDMVYTSLLTLAPLSDTHRQHLRDRALADSQIDSAMFGSLPDRSRSQIAKRLIEKHGVEVCFRVPGIIKKKNKHGEEYPTIAGFSGILIPARTYEGKIHSICIRRDQTHKNRYLWMSSSKAKGSSPGLITHVPFGIQPEVDVVRLTEGVLKSDVAFALSGLPTVGMPGIGNWKTALPVLKKLGAKKIIFSPDADFREKRQVAESCQNCVSALLNSGYEVELEVWGQRERH